MQPYRTMETPRNVKLQRRKAFIRGLMRRTAAPTFWVCFIAGLGLMFNANAWVAASARTENADAVSRQHFDAWQKEIDKNNVAMNVRQADLDRREREFNARIKTFEDVVSISALFMNNQNDPNRLRDVLARSGVINTNVTDNKK